MDVRRSINTRFWVDEWVEELDKDEKLLYLYLLTNQQTNIAGVYEISIKRISFETGIKSEHVGKIIEKFLKNGKVAYVDGWMIIKNWKKNQCLDGTQIDRAIQKVVDTLPSHIVESKKHLDTISIPYPYPMDTLSIPYGEKEKEIEIEKEIYICNSGELPIAWSKWSNDQFISESIQTNEKTLLPKSELEKFNEYWLSPSKTGKPAFKLQKTWSMSGRQRTWLENYEKSGKKPTRDIPKASPLTLDDFAGDKEALARYNRTHGVTQ